MKVQFLKNHLDYRQGETYEVADDTATYLIRVGAVTEGATDAKVSDTPKPKQVEAPKPKEKRAVRDMGTTTVAKEKPATDSDGKQAIEPVQPHKKGENMGALEPTVNSKPDKNQVIDSAKK